MKGSIKPRIKICCISSLEEAKMAIEFGADVLGLVGEMPSGPGVIDDELIYEITKNIPPGVSSFLLTSKTSSEEIINHHKKVNTNTIQIVDELEDSHYQEIRNALPGVKLVQVIHVLNESSIEEAIKKSVFVDALLLDSGNPNLKVKVLGGTGKIHNWDLSKTIREKVEVPVYLAGGLNSENIKKAIEYVQPFGVDLCSGVRTNGKLDGEKLSVFFDEVSQVRNASD